MNKLIFLTTLLLYFNCGQADYRDDALGLGVHNTWRKKHHSPDLVLSDDLNSYAQNWAQTMANSNNFQHSGGPYGENLYATGNMSVSDQQVAQDAANAWYSEVSKYDYNNPGFSMETGHFTQLVWKSTQKLGVGVARSDKLVYVCGSYDPPGNFDGEFADNVLPP